MRPIIPSYEQVIQLPLTYETVVSEDWIDVMGHMNVAYYTASFSSAMKSVRSSFGLDNETVAEKHVGTFAIETHTRYHNESHVGDRLHIHSRVLGRSKSKKRLHAMHLMVNHEKQFVSATFEAIVANVDLKQRRMAPILPEFVERLDALIAEHAKLLWAPPVCGNMSCD